MTITRRRAWTTAERRAIDKAAKEKLAAPAPTPPASPDLRSVILDQLLPAIERQMARVESMAVELVRLGAQVEVIEQRIVSLEASRPVEKINTDELERIRTRLNKLERAAEDAASAKPPLRDGLIPTRGGVGFVKPQICGAVTSRRDG